MSKVYVNFHFSGLIALADLAKVLPFVQIDNPESNGALNAAASTVTVAAAAPAPTPAAPPAPAAEASAAPTPPAPPAPAAEAEFDAAGVAWDPARHAATKGKTKDGLWRMKVGVARGEGEGLPAAAAAPTPPPPPAAAAPTPPAPPAAPPLVPAAEDDEFAAFRAAAGAEAPANPPAPTARTWADADLSKLCNQAAMATGNPEDVKAIIAQFVPEGEVPHSRNIPADRREDFAAAVESRFSITYAG